MIRWLFFPRQIDPDNPFARRLLRLGPGGASKMWRREPWFRSTAVLIWICCVFFFYFSPAILALAHAPFSGYRRRRRLMTDARLPELFLVPREPSEPAIALRAAVERWSRRMAIIAALAMAAGAISLAFSFHYETSSRHFNPRELPEIAGLCLFGGAFWIAAWASWWAGCHMRASVIAAWPRLWLSKSVGLAAAAGLKLAVVYVGGGLLLLMNALSFHGRAPHELAWLLGILGAWTAIEAVFFWLRLNWAEAAWRGAEASLAKELEAAALEHAGRDVEEG
jgi:hypothetical protein